MDCYLFQAVIPSCLPCPSLHSFLSSPVFFRFYHYVQCCYLYFLAALYFLDFPVYSPFSCPVPSLLFAFPVSIFLSNPLSPAITALSCSASYSILLSIPVLSLAVCPVSCCPSCLLLSVLSPVLSVTPDLFCLRNCIQTYNTKYSSGCHSQVFVNL